MTITSTPSEISYAGDDASTVFPIPFVFDSAADLRVIRTDPHGNPVPLTTGFSVTGGSGATGSLTLTTPLPSGYMLTILDNPEAKQSVDYIDNDSFPAETHERALDYLTRLVKRLNGRLRSVVRAADGDPSSGSGLELGSVEQRKGKYLFFNAVTGAIEYAVALVGQTLSQSLVGATLYPQTGTEISLGITPIQYQYPEGNVLRYGQNTVPDTTDMSLALQRAFDVAAASKGAVVIPPGVYRIDSQVVITAGSGTRANIDVYQAKGAVIKSYVTGSVAGLDTDGFGILIDGMADSNWYGLHVDFANGTAGVAMRCRNEQCYRNNFFGPKVIGGAVAADRETRSKIAWRIIGNESSAGSTGYTCYFNRFYGAHFTIAHILFDLVEGDGSASTAQPNAPVLIAPLFENYIVAIHAEDTDEITVEAAWWQQAGGVAHATGVTGITQTSGTATVSHTGHGYETDDIVIIAGATPSAYNGPKRITVVDANSYTFPIASGTSSPATGSITATLATCAFKGQTGFTDIHGIIDAVASALPYYLYDGSTNNTIRIKENSGIAGVVEDPDDSNFIDTGTQRLQGLRRISDRPHTANGARDLDIFGTGTASHSGAGRSRVRVWNNLGSTRNWSVGFKDGTTCSLAAGAAGTDISLDTASGEVARVMDAAQALAGRVLAVNDGVTEPGALTGRAVIYVDAADGDLKVKFADGFVATIAADS